VAKSLHLPGVFICLLFLKLSLGAQPLPRMVKLGPQVLKLQPSMKPAVSPQSWLPLYVRANPLDHAPLCRLETKIERKLPIGVWMRIDEGPAGSTANRAYVRFRIPLW
jgi:hypothetical protein